MLECKNCKSKWQDGARFCGVCGQALFPEYPFDPTKARETKEDARTKRQCILLNLFFSLILFFILFPMIFPSSAFRGYGEFGYGLRQQISIFAALAKPSMSTSLLLLIYSMVILLIIAGVFVVAFSIVCMVFLGKTRSKYQPINNKLLKVFCSCVFFPMFFIFFVTFPYLTFTFVCAHLLSLFAFLMVLKPDFATDILVRRGNEQRNTIALKILVFAVLLSCCFSPIYIAAKTGKWISYNCFNFIVGTSYGSVESIDVFLQAISIITLILVFLLFLFLIVRYLYFKPKKHLGIIDFSAQVLSVLFLILIGSFIRVENLRSTNPPELSALYYVFLSIGMAALIIPLIQKAIDYKNTKKIK